MDLSISNQSHLQLFNINPEGDTEGISIWGMHFHERQGSWQGLHFQSQLPLQEVGLQKGNRKVKDTSTSLGSRREKSARSS